MYQVNGDNVVPHINNCTVYQLHICLNNCLCEVLLYKYYITDGSDPFAAPGFTFGESIEAYSIAFRVSTTTTNCTILATQNDCHSNAFTVAI